MKHIAFDIDNTLHKVIESPDGKFHQVPDYDLIGVLRWFANNGDQVYIWSAGGVDYATAFAQKFGLDKLVTVIPKEAGTNMDLCFDDQEVTLAACNIQVRRDEIVY